MKSPDLRKTLRMARRVIERERDDMLDEACAKDVYGKPIRSTLDTGLRPFVQRLDRALKQIDAVLE